MASERSKKLSSLEGPDDNTDARGLLLDEDMKPWILVAIIESRDLYAVFRKSDMRCPPADSTTGTNGRTIEAGYCTSIRHGQRTRRNRIQSNCISHLLPRSEECLSLLPSLMLLLSNPYLP